MDERYLLAATRYAELNSVREGLVKSPRAYPWSSAAAHLTGRDDILVRASPLLDLIGNWVSFLSEELSDAEAGALRRHKLTGKAVRR
jgi:putative transposase